MKLQNARWKAKERMRTLKDVPKKSISAVGRKAKSTVKNINNKGKEKVRVIKVKIKSIKIADIFSFLNAVFGLLSILQAIQGNLLNAAIFLLLGVVMDYADGKIARLTGTASVYGIEIDSLCDLVTFGVAPGVFVFQLTNLTGAEYMTTLLTFSMGLLLVTGIIRLAKFNVQEIKSHYVGMPITMIGIIIPLCFFFGLPLAFYPYVLMASGLLMITPVKVRKFF
ncbi:CDP-diacylglycerol--serine O-phosphatidyltransferase [Candidatus Woesearchaeota archaeon]|nr:CDP-diacylglycerol--serine O-phosphatidyltransferase [Candidatus Woesearchaeota archaeon]|tara:strand:+ start:780 stop:1451 length:672 start_codon:yes stop_codon:yes gene_type:complete